MPRTLALALAALVVASVLAPVAAAGQADESASFEDNHVVVTRGDAVEITVQHSAAANLTIGSQEVGFQVHVPLGGSGTDSVTLRTYYTTEGPGTFLAGKSGKLSTPRLSEAMEPGNYRLSVSIDGVTEAVGTLEVRARGATNATAGVAPRGLNFQDADPGQVLSRFTASERVAVGDHAAFLVNESGLEWAMAGEGTDSDLSDALSVRLRQLDPEANTRAETYSFEDGDLRVVSDVGASDRFAVLWDTSGVALNDGSRNPYELVATLDASSSLVDEDEELLRKRVRLVEPEIRLSAEPSFTLAPWDDYALRVNGTTNLAPTSTLDLRALQEDPRAVLWEQTVSVSERGGFSATFSFDEAAVPNSFPLWVRQYVTESQATVTLTALNASLAFGDQQVSEGAVTVEDVNLSHPGFVRLAANGTTYGASALLQPGSHEAVPVSLSEPVANATRLNATVVADANGNATFDAADREATGATSPVLADALVIPPEDATTTTPSTTSTATTSGTTGTATRSLRTEASEPLTPAEAGGSSGGTVPLSPLAVVAALAAGALLAGRR